MSSNSTGENYIGIIPGTTWGTAATISGAQLIHGRWSGSSSRGEFEPEDVGFGNFLKELVKLEESVNITLDARLRFGCVIMQAITHIMGQDTATEVTASEGDYSHTIKLDAENDGEFSTFAASYGSGNTEVLEIPSVKWTRFNISGAVNQVPTVQVTGIGDQIVIANATNDLADLAGSTYQDDRNYFSFGDTNHYFRMNDQDGDALDSGDELDVVEWELEISRNMPTRYSLRGANTKFTNEPKTRGIIQGFLRLRFNSIDELNALSLWKNGTEQKAELFMDGSQIGGGTNRSYKFIFPRLIPDGQFPRGYDLPNNNSEMQPEITFRLAAADSAPTGMTGHTNYLSIIATNERSAAYT